MTMVTVLTVTYNSEKTVKKTIESVLAQTYKTLEYIIIDGASKDNTVEIAESYRQRFAQKGYQYVIISEPDQGMYDALNKGIHMAAGELVGGVNADDWYEPTAVEEMVRHYEEDAYDIAWSDIRIHTRTGTMIKHAKTGRLKTTARFCHPSMFAKREVLLELPYANRQFDDDFDMILRAYRAKKKICVYPQVLSNYQFGGMSTKKSLKLMRERIGIKYGTYRRNGYSGWYYFYCVAMEAAKYLLG